ncbi:hypothetical protein RvY_10774-2 [Ramazzottius varieornatus]|uniref:Uncharacterized protein n=1 Tax=Ramazzottius varieornatus TaxID=947166 RepID=A0A1D1VLP7_RAMVA|nr:hypothetical protein RvY_10774-2 [Ramazzottius varieornatus]
MMLEGALAGLKYYLVPDFKRLADPNMWIDAAGQVLFSLGVAFGGLMTLSSYNRFQNNCLRDALTIFCADTLTSFLSGCAIFAVLGFLSHESGEPIHDVVQAGSGLAFVAFPEAILRMPIPTFWSILFFFMLATLGADSVVAVLETVVIALAEKFPAIMPHRTSLLWGCCIVLFLLGLPMCTGVTRALITISSVFRDVLRYLLVFRHHRPAYTGSPCSTTTELAGPCL